MTQRAIAVLGMHRSGTSCLTGLLEDAGVFLGDVSKQNPFNRKGNQEKLSIMHLHDEVLISNGGSWDQPPNPPLTWSASQVDRLREIISDYRDVPTWGFKDPRSLFMLEQWRQELPSLEFIGTLRHPVAVAQSLQNRGKTPLLEGMDIWRRYNQRLLETWIETPFPMVNFDLAQDEYLGQVETILTRMGLLTTGAHLEFFDATLRNADQATSSTEMPAAVQALYDSLLECAGGSVK